MYKHFSFNGSTTSLISSVIFQFGGSKLSLRGQVVTRLNFGTLSQRGPPNWGVSSAADTALVSARKNEN